MKKRPATRCTIGTMLCLRWTSFARAQTGLRLWLHLSAGRSRPMVRYCSWCDGTGRYIKERILAYKKWHGYHLYWVSVPFLRSIPAYNYIFWCWLTGDCHRNVITCWFSDVKYRFICYNRYVLARADQKKFFSALKDLIASCGGYKTKTLVCEID